MPDIQTFYSENETQTMQIGMTIAEQLRFPSCVYLIGDLGAGKTTLTKSIIQQFGYSGAVTSPTYNLIQEYPVALGTIYHMDLYRLDDPSELEFLAIADLYNDNSLMLIEWPEKGRGYLMESSHIIQFEPTMTGRKITLT